MPLNVSRNTSRFSSSLGCGRSDRPTGISGPATADGPEAPSQPTTLPQQPLPQQPLPLQPVPAFVADFGGQVSHSSQYTGLAY